MGELHRNKLLELIRPIRPGRLFAERFLLQSMEGGESGLLHFEDRHLENRFTISIAPRKANTDKSFRAGKYSLSVERPEAMERSAIHLTQALVSLIEKNDARDRLEGLQGFEYEAVSAGIKPAMRTILPESSLPLIEKLSERDGLHCSVCGYGLDGKEGRLVYVGRRLSLVEELKETERRILQMEIYDDRLHADLTARMGRLLGYPDCCIDFFVANRNKSVCEIIRKSIEATEGRASSMLNVLDDRSVLSHLPCRLNCPATLAMLEEASHLPSLPDMKSLSGPYLLLLDGWMLKLEAQKGDCTGNMRVLHRMYRGPATACENAITPEKGDLLRIEGSILRWLQSPDDRKWTKEEWRLIEFFDDSRILLQRDS